MPAYCLIAYYYHFRTFANHLQVEVHKLLVALGLIGKYEVGRRVDNEGDCCFDAILAQLEDPRIRITLDPIFTTGTTRITTVQGL